MALRACGLIIFRRVPPAGDIEFLLLQTSYGTHHWTPPKGHVDPGEDDMAAALRETEEEAGLQPGQFRLLEGFREELNYQVRGKEKTVIYWLAELREAGAQVRLSNEHRDFRWLPLRDACAYSAHQDMQDTLNHAHRFLGGGDTEL
ncbi:bis(5'-nucleosyl)-tetraphosphatase [asymmetrical] [Mantella aurantiaca]